MNKFKRAKVQTFKVGNGSPEKTLTKKIIKVQLTSLNQEISLHKVCNVMAIEKNKSFYPNGADNPGSTFTSEFTAPTLVIHSYDQGRKFTYWPALAFSSGVRSL